MINQSTRDIKNQGLQNDEIEKTILLLLLLLLLILLRKVDLRQNVSLINQCTRDIKNQELQNDEIEERKIIVKTVQELYEFIDEKAINEVYILDDREWW